MREVPCRSHYGTNTVSSSAHDYTVSEDGIPVPLWTDYCRNCPGYCRLVQISPKNFFKDENLKFVKNSVQISCVLGVYGEPPQNYIHDVQ